MNTIMMIVIAGMVFGGYKYYEQKKQSAAAAQQTAASSTSFIDVPPITGDNGSVLVVAQENCLKEEAVRSDRLAEELAKNGVRVRRVHMIEFSGFDPQQYSIDRLNGLMNGQLPIVFVNGRGKSNPSLGEVLAEYKK